MNARTVEIDLTGIRERLADIADLTTQPWEIDREEVEMYDEWNIVTDRRGNVHTPICNTSQNADVAVFLRAAPEDIRALLTYIDALTAELGI